MDVCNYFLCELKDQRLLVIRHVPGDENEVDIFIKNTTGPVFKQHICKFVRDDKYMVEK